MSEIDDTIIKSFNENFCTELEYHVTRTLGNSPDQVIKHFWCDGVEMPEQLIKQNIINEGKIITSAWMGSDGQGKYEMIIKFGPQSINSCIKGFALKECLPNEKSMDWVNLDIEKKLIELQLK
jgi:hypothetical protein